MSENFQHDLACFFQYLAFCKAYFEAEVLDFVQGESFFVFRKSRTSNPMDDVFCPGTFYGVPSHASIVQLFYLASVSFGLPIYS